MNNDRGKSLQIPQKYIVKERIYIRCYVTFCVRGRTSQVILNISLRMK